MMWFLFFAYRRGLVVDHYADEPEGVLDTIDGRRKGITRVTLRPAVTWAGSPPSPEEEDAMHHEAHEACYIANSVRSEVIVEPRREGVVA
jgi:organic hydroperoxide reductase OsmC/OhrA